MNRLLINMKNKIDVIDVAIDMIYKLERGETIKFGEDIDDPLVMKFSISKKENNDFDFNKRLSELFDERENLQIRVNRMGG